MSHFINGVSNLVDCGSLRTDFAKELVDLNSLINRGLLIFPGIYTNHAHFLRFSGRTERILRMAVKLALVLCIRCFRAFDSIDILSAK